MQHGLRGGVSSNRILLPGRYERLDRIREMVQHCKGAEVQHEGTAYFLLQSGCDSTKTWLAFLSTKQWGRQLRFISGCMKFRQLMMSEFEMDPFVNSMTIAYACMAIYRSCFLPENTIAIVSFS